MSNAFSRRYGGEPGRSVEELATQFGVKPSRIHKIMHECKIRIERERDARRAEAAAKAANAAAERETCPLCKRELPLTHQPPILPICQGLYFGDSSSGALNSRCMIAQRQASSTTKPFPSAEQITEWEVEWEEMKVLKAAEELADRLKDNVRFLTERRDVAISLGRKDRQRLEQDVQAAKARFHAAMAEVRALKANRFFKKPEK